MQVCCCPANKWSAKLRGAAANDFATRPLYQVVEGIFPSSLLLLLLISAHLDAVGKRVGEIRRDWAGIANEVDVIGWQEPTGQQVLAISIEMC